MTYYRALPPVTSDPPQASEQRGVPYLYRRGLIVERETLACMDVWGGNQATLSSFEKPGIDIWLYSRPFRDHSQGGDVYYLSSCASGRITRMLLADVSGHGQEVADTASDLRRIMRRHINSVRAHKMFQEMNSDFAERSSGERFATSIVSSFFSPTSQLRLCIAGHPPPLILRSNSGLWEPLCFKSRSEDLPFGVIDVCGYTEVEIPLQVGDLVLCYTDGVIESFTPDGGQLGIDGLERILDKLPADRPEQILPEVVDRIGGEHEDDVTMLLYRVTDRSVSVRDNIAAPFRWFSGLFAKS